MEYRCRRCRNKGRVVIGLVVVFWFVSAWPGQAQRLQPEDLVYLGAFGMPDRAPSDPDELAWDYGGTAMAYYPHGDPAGLNDGFPGSLFGAGFNVTQYIAEFSIPPPVISPAKDPAALNTATMLQPFHDVRAGLFEGLVEMPRVGMAYLPSQAGQLTDKLHFGWGAHFQEDPGYDMIPSHMWCELGLANPLTAGSWFIGDYSVYSTNDYLFDIPADWAAAHTSGMQLATGRYRDGGWSGQGPALFAYGPWLDGLPPTPGARLSAVPLLLYGSTREGDPIPSTFTLNGYHHSDEWSGAAWLTAGGKGAVVFVGTKGAGSVDAWYGNEQGPCLTCENRGWWSEELIGQILFYDPADLAAVAQGSMETHEPQPYAALNIDPHLFYVRSVQQKYHVGAAAFDRERGLLYVFEPGFPGEPGRENDKTLVHVWRVEGTSTGVEEGDEPLPQDLLLEQNYPNPFNGQTTIGFRLPAPGAVRLTVMDLLGRERAVLVEGHLNAGSHDVAFEAERLPSAIYLYRLDTPHGRQTRKMVLIR